MTIKAKRIKTNPPSKKEVYQGQYDSKVLITPYESLYMGYASSEKVRNLGSSGGIATALFDYLITKKLIDGVLAVKNADSDPLSMIYDYFDSPGESSKFSGSKYVYIEFSSLIEQIKKHDNKKIAIICQPCHVAALRNFQKNKFTNIKYIFSFFCGYNISKDATHYLASKTAIKEKNIKTIEYRGGGYPGGFRVVAHSGETSQWGKECYEMVDLRFLLKGCHRCPLYMGEGADIVFGDAWVKEHKNYTAIITRTTIGEDLLQNALKDKLIKLFELKEHDLIKMHWHNLSYKKYGHGKIMNFILFIFKDFLPEWIIPFHLLRYVSKVRRVFKIGISIPHLKKVHPLHTKDHETHS